MDKVMKLCLCVFLTAMAIGLAIAVASLLLYALVFVLLAGAAAFLLAPEDLRRAAGGLSGTVDKILSRVEALWREVKAALDAWGEREMAKANARSEPASGTDASPAGTSSTLPPDRDDRRG